MARRAIAKFCAGVSGWYSTYWEINNIEVEPINPGFSVCQSAKPQCGAFKVI